MKIAAPNPTVDKNTNVSKKIQAKIDKILSVDNPNGIKGVDTKNSTDTNNSLALSSTPNEVIPVLIRNGDTTSVQVLLRYTGSDLANSISITSATIKSTSLLFKTTYGSFGSKSYAFDYPTTYTYVSLVSISVPTNVSTVKFNTTGLMVYVLTDGTFHSFINISGDWPIN